MLTGEALRRKVMALLGGSLERDILADAVIALVLRETGRLGGRPRIYTSNNYPDVSEPVKEHPTGDGRGSDLISDPDLISGSGSHPDPSKQIRKNSKSDERLPRGFIEDFWSLYPRHRRVARARAVRAWLRQKPEPDKVRAALTWQVRLADWTKDGGVYVPYPEKYLNARRWEDEQQADPRAAARKATEWQDPYRDWKPSTPWPTKNGHSKGESNGRQLEQSFADREPGEKRGSELHAVRNGRGEPVGGDK